MKSKHKLIAGLLSAAVLAACSNPNRVSQNTAAHCLHVLEKEFVQVTEARSEYEKLVAGIEAGVKSGKIDKYTYQAAMDEIRSVESEFSIADNVRLAMVNSLERGQKEDVKDIGRNAGDPSWCSGEYTFSSPKSAVADFFERHGEAIEKTAKEERMFGEQELETQRINAIKDKLRKKARRTYVMTDQYGALVQVFDMPDGNLLKCKTDATVEDVIFWCEGGYDRYAK